MQHSFRPTFAKRLNVRFAPAFIAIGLIVLLTAGTWPQAPMISAMALIAVGATDLTIERIAALKTSGHWLSLHCLTYGTLYTLFVCAKLGKADINLTTINVLIVLDVLMSLVPMAIASRRVLVAFRQHSASQ